MAEGAREQMRARIEARKVGREEDHRRARRREDALGALSVVGFAATIAALGFQGALGLPWWGICAIGAGVVVPLVQLRVSATLRRKKLGWSLAWSERALRRLDDHFAFEQDDGAAYADREHPYSDDLDLFGPGSLFARVNDTRTTLGRDALAALLRGEGEAAERRAVVEELRDAVALREALEMELRAVEESEARHAVDRARLERQTRELLAWGREPAPPPDPQWLVAGQIALGAVATTSVALKFALGWPWLVVLPFYLLNLFLLGRAAEETARLESRFSLARTGLASWSRAFAVLEEWEPEGERLRALRAPLLAADGGPRASRAIRRLGTLLDRLGWRANMAWGWSLGVLWLWDFHARRGLLAWQRAHGAELEDWLRSLAEVEAHASLATYAEAVPEQPFATIRDEGPWLDAADLAHALLPRAERVGNDLRLEGDGAVLLVSGSNMSGKSTLLRATGLAVVLTELGLPVPAARLALRRMRLVSCMRVSDSLQRGSSRFHAEVARLKTCVTVAQAGEPTLVLLDEILAGTNSRDRHVGTVAVLGELAHLPATTLLSTHDLSLARVGETGEAGAARSWEMRVVHFRDDVRDGAMHFDYRLREGVLPASNALEVMRLVGLRVPEDESGTNPRAARAARAEPGEERDA